MPVKGSRKIFIIVSTVLVAAAAGAWRFAPLPSLRERTLIRSSYLTYVIGFSQGGSTLVAYAEEEESIKLWDVATGKLLRTIRIRDVFPEGAIPTDPDLGIVGLSASLSPKGDILELATDAEDGYHVSLVDLVGSRGFQTFEGDTVYFSADSKMIAVRYGQRLRIWDVRTRRELTEIDQRGDEYASTLAFTPDGKTLVVAIEDSGRRGKVELWETEGWEKRKSFELTLGGSQCMAISPDGRTLAAETSDSTVDLWDLDSSREKAVLKLAIRESHGPLQMAFGPDNRYLAIRENHGGELRVYDVETASIRLARQGVRDNPSPMLDLPHSGFDFSPDGKSLAFVPVSEVARHAWMAPLPGWLQRRLSPYFGTYKTLKSRVILEEIATGRVVGVARVEKAVIYTTSLSPDGKTLATSEGGLVRLWDVPGEVHRGHE